VHKCPKGEAVLQVTPKVRTSLRCRNNFAARITSVVSPERETNTTCVAPLRRNVSSGANSSSDAGTAIQGIEKSRIQMAQTSCDK
jgi:hypothetical protein